MSLSVCVDSLITPGDSARCVCVHGGRQWPFSGSGKRTSFRMTRAAAPGPGASININGREQVDWELSYQGGSS